MKKPIIGYASSIDPFTDRRAWSGTLYKVRESIENAGFEVRWIPFTNSFWSRSITLLYRIRAKITGKRFSVEHIPSVGRLQARSIDKELMAGCDALFFCAKSTVLSQSNISKPIFYLSDATFELMPDYYWHNLDPLSIRYGNRIEQQALEKADCIIHSSQWAHNSAVSFYHTDPQKLHIIELGANLDEHMIKKTYARKELMQGDTLHILFSGVEWKRKGGEIAVETVNALNKKGIHAILHIAGIAELPKQHENNPHIDHVGFLNKNIPDQYLRYAELWQHADILLLPTRAECSSIVYCEAAGYGIPTFTTDTGGISNYVKNGINGYRLPLNAGGADFAESIYECIKNGELPKLSEGGKKLYAEKLSWSAWSRKFAEIANIYI